MYLPGDFWVVFDPIDVSFKIQQSYKIKVL